jgi:hypothetical protein
MSFAFAALAQKNNKVAGSKMSTPTKYHSAVATRNRINNSSSTDSHTEIIHLQRTIGNQAVQKLLRSNNTSGGFDFAKIGIQPKLKVSQPGDAYEQEADRVAEQVMRMPISSDFAAPMATTQGEEGIDRKCSACEMEEEEKMKINRKASNASTMKTTNKLANEIDNIRSSEGASLDENTRESMESRFGGYDFGNVRIHTDERAARSANSVDAFAYTIGNDIMFDEGQYTPNTLEGRRLLAHELTHVIQQQRNDQQHMRSQGRKVIPEREIGYGSGSTVENISTNNDNGGAELSRQVSTTAPAPAPGVQPPSPPVPLPMILNWPPENYLRDPPPEYSSYSPTLISKLSSSYAEHNMDRSLLANSFWGTTPTNASTWPQTLWAALDNIGQANKSSLLEVTNRAILYPGIWQKIDRIRNIWTDSSRGFKFKSYDEPGLRSYLDGSPYFCRDSAISEFWYHGSQDCWREVGRVGMPGLHICLGNNLFPDIHIDGHQIAEGKEDDGSCNIDWSAWGSHIKDVW